MSVLFQISIRHGAGIEKLQLTLREESMIC